MQMADFEKNMQLALPHSPNFGQLKPSDLIGSSRVAF
jgi:hypothetical protein